MQGDAMSLALAASVLAWLGFAPAQDGVASQAPAAESVARSGGPAGEAVAVFERTCLASLARGITLADAAREAYGPAAREVPRAELRAVGLFREVHRFEIARPAAAAGPAGAPVSVSVLSPMGECSVMARGVDVAEALASARGALRRMGAGETLPGWRASGAAEERLGQRPYGQLRTLTIGLALPLRAHDPNARGRTAPAPGGGPSAAAIAEVTISVADRADGLPHTVVMTAPTPEAAWARGWAPRPGPP